jgi:hypothetical protein
LAIDSGRDSRKCSLTEAESEAKAAVLKASKNASGVADLVPAVLACADTGAFVTATGAHVSTCGVYVLYGSTW